LKIKKLKRIIISWVAVVVWTFAGACGQEKEWKNPVETIAEQTEKKKNDTETYAISPREEAPANKPENSNEGTDGKESSELSGTVESVEDNGFIFSKSDTWEDENGGQVEAATLVEEEKEFIHAVFTESTEFILVTSDDGGITSRQDTASANDLEAGQSVQLEGVYQGEEFAVSKVSMYRFL